MSTSEGLWCYIRFVGKVLFFFIFNSNILVAISNNLTHIYKWDGVLTRLILIKFVLKLFPQLIDIKVSPRSLSKVPHEKHKIPHQPHNFFFKSWNESQVQQFKVTWDCHAHWNKVCHDVMSNPLPRLSCLDTVAKHMIRFHVGVRFHASCFAI